LGNKGTSQVDAAIWGLIGTVIGALASIATTWLSAKSSTEQQETRARTERLERANAFQRETLLELQEAIHDALRLVHRAYIEDCESQRKGTPWSKAMLGEELSEGIRLASRKVLILVERAADDSVRLQVKTLMRVAHQAMLETNEADARRQLERCDEHGERCLEVLGNVLRSHY
jgi:predicted RNA polymerase sigma factor